MVQKVVVTGASGHIGYHVAKLLIEKGNDVHLLIRTKNRNTDDLEKSGATVHFADLFNPSSYEKHFENSDALFHLAAENTTDTSDEQRVIDSTYLLTKKVLDTAIEKKVKTIIYTSSVVVLGRSPVPERLLDESSVVGFPESPYVKGKFLAERYCDELIKNPSVDIRRLYPSWVVGNHDSKITPPHKLIRNFVNKGQSFYFNGGISVASVEEVAKAHVNAWLVGKANEKYVVAGDNISFLDFYSLLAKYSGHKAPAVLLPKWFLHSAAVILKFLLGKKNPVDPNYIDSVIGNYSWYNSQKAVKELGYTVLTADTILKDAVYDARKKMAGLDQLSEKNNPSLKRIKFEEDDVLLITGFPGLLGNRTVDILMNGDRFGNNAVDRKIKLLVQPVFKGMISLPSNFEIVYGDITDPSTLRDALTNVKTVYHFAGIIYANNADLYDKVNFLGTKNMVDVCIEKGTKRFLYMGTDSICGYGRTRRIFDENTQPNPYKNYGRSKYLGEKYLLDKTSEGKLDGTSIRGFWFFGPFMPERNLKFFKMFFWKKQVVFGDGKNFRSISHVDNLVQAFIKAEKKKETVGKWYWAGDKKADYTVDEIYSNIAEGLGTKYNPVYIPKLVCELLSVLDSILTVFGILNPTIYAAGKFHKDIAGEITAAQRDFDYRPDVGFEEIKKESASFVKANMK